MIPIGWPIEAAVLRGDSQPRSEGVDIWFSGWYDSRQLADEAAVLRGDSQPRNEGVDIWISGWYDT